MKLSSVTVKLQLPYIGGIEGNWQPDGRERDAAWEMYVELITRVAVVELRPDEGLIREALTSLYSLFDTTRGILRKYGPSIAKSKRGSDLSFGYIAVSVLNGLLRPLLAKWHPLLADHEAQRAPGGIAGRPRASMGSSKRASSRARGRPTGATRLRRHPGRGRRDRTPPLAPNRGQGERQLKAGATNQTCKRGAYPR